MIKKRKIKLITFILILILFPNIINVNATSINKNISTNPANTLGISNSLNQLITNIFGSINMFFPKGSVTVTNLDKEGNIISTYKDTNLKLTKHTYFAEEIENYKVVGKTKKSIRLSLFKPKGTIKFVYCSINDSVDPPIDENPSEPLEPPNLEEPSTPIEPPIIEKPNEPVIPPTDDTTKDVIKNEVPYISSYYVNPIIKPNEEVIIDFYLTDYDQQEYKEGESDSLFTVTAKVEGKEDIVKTGLKSGDNSISLGKFSDIGEVKFSLICTDEYNRNSHELFHFFKVTNETLINEYVMTKEDLTTYNIKANDTYGEVRLINVDTTNKTMLQALTEAATSIEVPSNSYIAFVGDSNNDGKRDSNWKETVVKYSDDYNKEKVALESRATREGLQNLINDKKTEGYNQVKLLNSIYRVDHNSPLYIPNEFTLDMNGATLKLNQFSGDEALMIDINNVSDSHVKNGIIKGDYYEHDYTNSPNNSEWVNGIAISNEALYCSYENITVEDITGYGVTNGINPDGGGYLHYTAGSLKNFISGDINRNTGELIEESTRTTSDFLDISKALNNDYLSVSRYLGYQGVSGGTWNIICHFYDADKNYIKSIDSYQYRRVRIPENSKYLRVTLLNNEYPTDLNVQYFKVPTNSSFKNIKIDNVRCVGMAQAAMNNFLVEDIEISSSGQSSAKCAYDAEDGWDMMQDVTFREMNFHDNPYNEFLTCAGHNFVIEDMIAGKIYLWPRTNSYTIRNNNNIKSITSEYENRTRTGYSRITNNIVNESINAKGAFIKNNTAGSINASNISNCTIYSIPSNDTKTTNSTIILDSFSSYLSGKTEITDCIIKPKDGVEEYRISFNQLDAERIFTNVQFLGKAKLDNHNSFNTATFNNCTFEDATINPGVSNSLGNIEFNNCTINSTSENLIRLSPHAYSRGLTNVNFNDCNITHSGSGSLIYLYAKPTGGQMTFNNTTINKNEGFILDGYGSLTQYNDYDSIYMHLKLKNSKVTIPVLIDKYNDPKKFNLITE